MLEGAPWWRQYRDDIDLAAPRAHYIECKLARVAIVPALRPYYSVIGFTRPCLTLYIWYCYFFDFHFIIISLIEYLAAGRSIISSEAEHIFMPLASILAFFLFFHGAIRRHTALHFSVSLSMVYYHHSLDDDIGTLPMASYWVFAREALSLFFAGHDIGHYYTLFCFFSAILAQYILYYAQAYIGMYHFSTIHVTPPPPH